MILRDIEDLVYYKAMLRDMKDGRHLVRSPRVEQQTRREHKALPKNWGR